MASWWHEAARGGRAFVLSDESIQWLRERIPEDTPFDAETPNGPDGQTNAEHIFRCMDKASEIPSYDHNWVEIAGLSKYRSSFVNCSKISGEISLEGHARVMHRRETNGKLNVMRGQAFNCLLYTSDAADD